MLIDNATYQRATLLERPIRQPLNIKALLIDKFVSWECKGYVLH